MKKIFVACIALAGVAMLISGIVKLFSMEFIPISNQNMAYGIGYNLGLLIEKIGKACLGIIIIKFCHGWFCDLEKNVE